MREACAISEKKAGSAPVNLTGLLVAKQGQIFLVKRLCKVGENCAGVQLGQHQQRAKLEQKRFESVVNDAFSTTLKGK